MNKYLIISHFMYLWIFVEDESFFVENLWTITNINQVVIQTITLHPYT